MDQIVGRYGAEREAETDEEEDFKKPIGLKQAVEALETLNSMRNSKTRETSRFSRSFEGSRTVIDAEASH